ncbi:hypothetical protein [Catenuloplanes japonicus]|uniref:hypothetical protein n=1 Tax=Catenuloplanes japonicus TaxID=33876 RepID=UPI00052712AA|nr:hypothetical protein [Catenuloplanes japonicus]
MTSSDGGRSGRVRDLLAAWLRLTWHGRLTWAALALLLVAGLPGMCVTGQLYASSHLVEVERGEPIRFTATEGERVTLALRVAKSVNSYWQAPRGVVMTLAGDGDQQLAPPRNDGWGDSILTDSSAEEQLIVRASITVPAAPGTKRRTVTGAIKGDVSYPVDAGGREFVSESVSVAAPVEITVVPTGNSGGSRGTGPVLTFVYLDLTLGFLLVGLAATALAANLRRRALARRGQPREGGGLSGFWMGLFGLAFSGALFLGGLSTVLQLGSGLYRTLGERAVLDAPGPIIWAPVTVPALLWAATVIGMSALAAKPADEPAPETGTGS